MTVAAEARIETTEWDDGDYAGWTFLVTVEHRIYVARRYRDEPEIVTFMYFSDPRIDEKDRRLPFSGDDPEGDRMEPFRNGKIPYKDPRFRAAARAVLDLPGVSGLLVLTSNRSGTAAPVNLERIFPGVA